MNPFFNKYLEIQIEKHLPTTLIDFELMARIFDVLSDHKRFGRREILILAYVLGLNAAEADVLLTMADYPKLYVKRYEDGVWRFALNNRRDCNSIIEKIFPEKADDISET